MSDSSYLVAVGFAGSELLEDETLHDRLPDNDFIVPETLMADSLAAELEQALAQEAQDDAKFKVFDDFGVKEVLEELRAESAAAPAGTSRGEAPASSGAAPTVAEVESMAAIIDAMSHTHGIAGMVDRAVADSGLLSFVRSTEARHASLEQELGRG